MKTTIKDKAKWIEYYAIAGMTAIEWARQILGYERETETRHADVMSGLRIGGWSHSYHYAGNHGIENTQHAYEKLTEEVNALAEELDKRLHELTAVENELREMAMEISLANVELIHGDPDGSNKLAASSPLDGASCYASSKKSDKLNTIRP